MGEPDGSIDEAERLATVIAARRAAVWVRMIGSLAIAVACAPSAPWMVSAVWWGAFSAVQLIEWVTFSPARTEQVARSPRLRLAAICLLLVESASTGGFAMGLLVFGRPFGLGLAMACLAITMMIAAVGSQGSRSAFLAAIAPQGLYMVFGVPIVLVASQGAPWLQGLGFTISGAVGLGLTAYLWRQHGMLLRSEAEARRKAQSASAAKSTFIATVSHELRTPISAIQAGALELERVIEDAGQRRSAALILDAGRMMRTLLDDLLDLSKAEAGRMSVESIAFDVRSVILDTLRFWQAEARKKGLRLTLVGARALPQWICGDPTRLKQVFNNLFSNAIKFTSEGGIVFRVEVGEGSVSFSIEDTGPGLSGEQMARLFTPFTQAETSTSRTHGGTGLGLALSRGLTRLMGGDLSVASAAGEGARFKVTLPLELAAPAAARQPDANLRPASSLAPRVLVVDDHEINRRAMALVLQPIGAEVSFAADGGTALELLDRQAFDVVLLDVHMPEMDGLEVTRRLRLGGGLNCATPVIAVTGAVEDHDRARCLQAGMNACVGKPIEPAELYAAFDAVNAGSAEEAGPADASSAAA